VVIAPLPIGATAADIRQCSWGGEVLAVEFDSEFTCMATIFLKDEKAKQDLMRSGMGLFCSIISIRDQAACVTITLRDNQRIL
jgi:hypothetical protein